MSRYHPKPINQMLNTFWRNKIKKVLEKYPASEKHYPVSKDEVNEQLSNFAKKIPQARVHIETIDPNKENEARKYFTSLCVREILTTITFEEWPEDRIFVLIAPSTSAISFRVVSTAGLDDGYANLFEYSYNCNIETTLANAVKFVKNYPKYREQAESKRNAKEKAEKLEEMGRKSIETIVPQMMNASKYEWSLVHNDIRHVLFVKMKKRKMLMISLTPKTFASKVGDLLNVISQMEKMIDEVPYAVDVRNCSTRINWRKGANTES